MISKTNSISTKVDAKSKRINWLPSSSNLSEAQFAYFLLIPLIISLVAILGFPLLYSVWLSFHQILLGRGAWTFVGFDQYTRALSDPMFINSGKLTIIYTAATTLITFVISLSGALLLNENFRGKKLLLILTILPWALSTYATAVLWRYMYSSQVGLINAVFVNIGIISEPINFLSPEFAIFAIAIAHAWQMAPFGIYFLLASLQLIPPDLYRVARIDRLGMMGRFRHVTFPYIQGAMMAMAMLIILAAARIFDIIYFITYGGPGTTSTTLTYYIYMTTFKAYDIGYGSALSTLLLLGILILMIVYFAILLYQKKGVRK